ncbi:MAG: hypothetical protein JW704_12060 [Anaerolineaceae bacterium]|nr:hypothetical protein [Anaerolineaceae bacterium]
MLQKLISTLRSGDSHEIRSLAARLETTPEMVEAMLEHLQHIGLINPFNICKDACTACPLAGGCQAPLVPHLLIHTSTSK